MTVPRVLVVDDNPITRKVVRFALEQHGFGILEAETGEEALAQLDREAPDLVLQDLVLPDIDGFDLVARLRGCVNGREIPILAFSGLLSKIDETRVSVVGFDDVIVKPVEPSRLVQIVKAHVPMARGSREFFGTGRRLLVVDDDPVQLKLARFRLSRLGFEVDGAADGVEALEKLRRQVPDALVSDVMMPRLDGFGLCLAVREDPRLARLPVILMTNSYLEQGDQDLARRAGANAFVFRTPEMSEMVAAVRRTLLGGPPAEIPVRASSPPSPTTFEEDRTLRLLRQLERQVSLNAGIAQRCSTLSAELCVLSGISEALAKDQDPDTALDAILAACLDAGGISVGALFLPREDGTFQVHTVGADLDAPGSEGERGRALERFFGVPELLAAILKGGRTVALPSPGLPEAQARAVLEGSGARSALVAPLVQRGRVLGGLVMLSRSTDLHHEDRIAFAQGVANQIAQALALTQAFAEKRTSERKALEQATVLQSVLESIADGVVVVDAQGRFTIWNPAAEATVGMGPIEGPIEDWTVRYRMFRPDQVTPFPTGELPLIRAMAGQSVDRVEIYLRRDGDGGKWIDVNARPLKDVDGEVRGGVAVFRDITAEKVAHAQLMVSDRMASVGTLAAGVAHEINNPLTALSANLELAANQLDGLLDGMPPSEEAGLLREELKDALEAAERVRLIVRDLKTFSRAEDEAVSHVDVRSVLDSSLRMAWTEIRHRAQLVKDYGEVPPVAANEARLGQVLLNLIVNAAQALPEGQADRNEIRLVTRAESGRRVVVEVTDSGPGISPDVLPRLFTPFFTTKPVGVGTGLGLSICRRLVTLMGGEIAVESQPGRGTTFRVTIPAAPQVEAKAPVVTRTEAATRRGRILVVDDEEAIGRSVGRLLGRAHEVVTLTKAAQAAERIAGGDRFDVILCDLMMPVMTGMELYAELRRIAPDQADRVIFVTGGAFTPKARAFLDEVDNPRVEKPFDVAALTALINDRLR